MCARLCRLYGSANRKHGIRANGYWHQCSKRNRALRYVCRLLSLSALTLNALQNHHHLYTGFRNSNPQPLQARDNNLHILNCRCLRMNRRNLHRGSTDRNQRRSDLHNRDPLHTYPHCNPMLKHSIQGKDRRFRTGQPGKTG